MLLQIPSKVWDIVTGNEGESHEDYLSFKRWFPATEDGGRLSVDSELPVVWPRARRSGAANPSRPDDDKFAEL